jgi:hypothetical protein
MTRKDFQIIADVLKAAKTDQFQNLLFVEALSRTNDRFDSKRFLKACDHENAPLRHWLKEGE